MHRQRTFHRPYQYPSQDTPLVSLGRPPNSVGGDRWGCSVGIRVFAVVRGKSARVAQSSFKSNFHVAAGRRDSLSVSLHSILRISTFEDQSTGQMSFYTRPNELLRNHNGPGTAVLNERRRLPPQGRDHLLWNKSTRVHNVSAEHVLDIRR